MAVSPNLQAERADLVNYFDSLAATRDRWIEKNWYYHQEIARTLSFSIPPGSSVLEIGCSTGHLLNALKPGRGLGIDISPAMVEIARGKYPHLEFRVDDVEDLKTDEKFDYVVLIRRDRFPERCAALLGESPSGLPSIDPHSDHALPFPMGTGPAHCRTDRTQSKRATHELAHSRGYGQPVGACRVRSHPIKFKTASADLPATYLAFL